MSSPYPVLDNRPIDHWKVTELKEELKRRKLTTKGLKDDLVKRLAEALRIEREKEEALRIENENDSKNGDNGVDCVPDPVVGVEVSDTDTSLTETAKNIADCEDPQIVEADNVAVKVDINDSVAALAQEEAKEADSSVGTNSAGVEANLVVHTTTVETVITVSESVVSEVSLDGQDSKNTETQKENGDSNPQPEDEDSNPQAVVEDSKPQPVDEDSKPVQEEDVSKPKPEDKVLESAHRIVMPNTSAPDNQVSEVSPTLGSQVKSDSISTDSVSINEKIELKDNIIADNVKLELDVVKPEMVEPSSSNVDPVGGESHPMDVEEPHENKTSVEANGGDNAANADMSKKNDTVDVVYSEKLNLDRSSGDDSMEEDVIETTKHIDSKYNSDDVVDRNEKTEDPVANEETPVDVVGDGLSLDKDIHIESTNRTAVPVLNEESSIAVPVEKRKHNDQEAVGSSEPLKRQRRWNSESVKVPESQSLNPTTPTTTPKETFQSTSFKRSFSMSDSKTNDDAPKERVVPPSQKPPTNSLRIDRFLRPFTLKAVQELLGKTGTVSSFWMDQIKTHCYVTYSSVEEATETRNAVYNLQWPPNGGRLLAAEFVEPQEVKMRVDGIQTPATPVSTTPAVSAVPPAAQAPMPSPRLQAPSLRQPAPRQQPLPPPPPPPSTLPPAARERLPPPPPLPTPHDPPIVTLDDLFRKTRATPRIYYLPLSEEQVAVKLAAKGKKPLL